MFRFRIGIIIKVVLYGLRILFFMFLGFRCSLIVPGSEVASEHVSSDGLMPFATERSRRHGIRCFGHSGEVPEERHAEIGLYCVEVLEGDVIGFPPALWCFGYTDGLCDDRLVFVLHEVVLEELHPRTSFRRGGFAANGNLQVYAYLRQQFLQVSERGFLSSKERIQLFSCLAQYDREPVPVHLVGFQ